MLEYHGTCTILAINRIHESVQLKLLMGGIRECIQDNFPLGKDDWINANIDNDPRAAYFRQMENGLYVRMALIQLLI